MNPDKKIEWEYYEENIAMIHEGRAGVLTLLGSRGWELISIFLIEGIGYIHTFKRQKVQPTQSLPLSKFIDDELNPF